MEIFTKMCRLSTFLAAIGLIAFFGCGKVDLVEDLTGSQESFTRATSLTVTGKIVDPDSGNPVAGTKVKSNSFSATTDSNGNFSASLDGFSDSELITVSKDGHINYQFAVSYTGISDGAVLTWQVNLPKRQECIWVGPEEGAWYRYTTNGTEYVIDIQRGSVRDWTQICVSPSGTVSGDGIGQAFSHLGMIAETPRNPGEFLQLSSNPIDIRGYTATGDDGGNGNPGQSLFIHYLPGVGQLVPGGGIIFEELFYPFDFFPVLDNVDNGGNGGGGTVGARSEPIPLNNNPAGVTGLPHQAVGDGGG